MSSADPHTWGHVYKTPSGCLLIAPALTAVRPFSDSRYLVNRYRNAEHLSKRNEPTRSESGD
jgi:hypothetical protein